MTLPREAPDAPSAWLADELREDEWVRRFDDGERQELLAAVAATRDVPFEELDPARVPLPRLGPRLATLRHDLEHGRGLARWRGFPVESLDEDGCRRAFLMLGGRVGTPVVQDAEGRRLLDVRNAGYREDDPRFRGPLSNRGLRFHSDRCDVIAFLCLRPARRGGENHIVSSLALYRELRARDPAALARLCRAWVHRTHSMDAASDRRSAAWPIFSFHDGHFAASYLRVLIERADRDPELPDLTAEDRAALDRLEELAEEPRFQLRFEQAPGDLLFLNNWVTFHRRTAFEDDPAAPRHLLRLWLSVPNSRPLDPRFADNLGATAAGALRGGLQRWRGAQEPDGRASRPWA